MSKTNRYVINRKMKTPPIIIPPCNLASAIRVVYVWIKKQMMLFADIFPGRHSHFGNVRSGIAFKLFCGVLLNNGGNE